MAAWTPLEEQILRGSGVDPAKFQKAEPSTVDPAGPQPQQEVTDTTQVAQAPGGVPTPGGPQPTPQLQTTTPQPFSPTSDPTEMLRRIEAASSPEAAAASPVTGTPPTADPAAAPVSGAGGAPFQPTQDPGEILRRIDEAQKSSRQSRASGGADHAAGTEFAGGVVQRLVESTTGVGSFPTGPLPTPQKIYEIANGIRNMVTGRREPPDPAYVSKLFRQGLESIGIPASTHDTWSGEFGKQAFDGAMFLTVMYGGGANALANATPKFFRQMGEAFKQHPYLMAMLETGSAAGAATAAHTMGGEEGSIQHSVAEIAGGIVGGGLTSVGISGGKAIGRGLGNLVMNGIQKVDEWIRGGPNLAIRAARGTPTAYSGPTVRDPSADPRLAHVFADQQIEGDRINMVNAIKNEIKNVPNPGGTPESWAEATNTLINRARDYSKRIVDDYWDRVPKKASVPMNQAWKDLEALKVEYKDRPSSFPGRLNEKDPKDVWDEAMALGRPVTQPGQKGARSNPPTVERVRDLRESIYRSRMEEQALGTSANNGKIAAYNRIEGILDNALSDALVGDVSLMQARAASIAHHDLFSRGAIPDLLAKSRRGELKINPGETIDYLKQKYTGFNDVVDMVDQLSKRTKPGTPLPPGVQGPVKGDLYHPPGSTSRAELDATRLTMENSIRAEFHQAAAAAAETVSGEVDPAKLARLTKGIESKVKPMAGVATEMHDVATQLQKLHAERQAMEKSALARYAKVDDTQKLTSRVFGADKPIEAAQELVGRFRGNPQAINGFRASIVDHLLEQTKGDPALVRAFLTKHANVFKEVLSPDQHSRLYNLLDIAEQIARGDIQKWGVRHLTRFTIMGGMLGAMVGRHLGAATGAPTIQGPGIMASFFRKKAIEMFGPDNPTLLLRNAILNEDWEKTLMKRVPQTTKEAGEIVKAGKRLIKGFQVYHGTHLPFEDPKKKFTDGEAFDYTPYNHEPKQSAIPSGVPLANMKTAQRLLPPSLIETLPKVPSPSISPGRPGTTPPHPFTTPEPRPLPTPPPRGPWKPLPKGPNPQLHAEGSPFQVASANQGEAYYYPKDTPLPNEARAHKDAETAQDYRFMEGYPATTQEMELFNGVRSKTKQINDNELPPVMDRFPIPFGPNDARNTNPFRST